MARAPKLPAEFRNQPAESGLRFRNRYAFYGMPLSRACRASLRWQSAERKSIIRNPGNKFSDQ
jgi:hypothetical protein